MSDDQPLKIAYFGLPLGALTLAKAGFTPRVISLGHVDAVGARRVRRRLSAHSLVLGKPDLTSQTIVHAIASVQPDVIISWFWPKRIPENVLALAPRGAFGAHPSLLPLWRGPDPYFWPIYAGDRETGVSLHRLAAEYDTGAVVAQRRMSIDANDTSWSLAKKLDRPGLALLVECVTRLSRGEALLGEPQCDDDTIEAPSPDADTLTIVWKRPCAAILRLIRAAAPYPGASTTLCEHEVEITRAHRFEGVLPRAFEPGDAVLTEAGVVMVTGDGGLVIDQLRTELGQQLRGEDLPALCGSKLAHLPA